MHWAFVNVRMGEEFKAANNFRKSFALLKENRERFPDFDYNNIMFGLEEATVGAIPDDYKWIAAIFGMRGSVRKGMAKLETFINKHTPEEPMYDDALMYYAYLKYYLQSEQEQAWQLVNSEKFTAQNKLLLVFVKINIALNYRKADIAIAALRNAVTPTQYKAFPVFYYEMGNALLHKLDPECLRYYDNFLSSYNGGSFVKDAWHKKALFYYMQGNMAKAKECSQMVSKVGKADFDSDKKAKRFTEAGIWSPVPLLQASQLIDGGYYTQALNKLNQYKESDFNTVPDKAEYHFRLGRAYDELGDDNKALLYYKNAITIGRERKEHFAARSALHSGMIYERRKQYPSAISQYQLCLDLPVQDFKNSIRQQAKAGINRLTVK
jgi:tetratricopeptide (TPR) repeat protein